MEDGRGQREKGGEKRGDGGERKQEGEEAEEEESLDYQTLLQSFQTKLKKSKDGVVVDLDKYFEKQRERKESDKMKKKEAENKSQQYDKASLQVALYKIQVYIVPNQTQALYADTTYSNPREYKQLYLTSKSFFSTEDYKHKSALELTDSTYRYYKWFVELQFYASKNTSRYAIPKTSNRLVQCKPLVQRAWHSKGKQKIEKVLDLIALE